MVRINLIEPKNLADQHLVAEYDEILMLLGYVRRYPEMKDIPQEYCLGKGHIKFFKDKLQYIYNRHELLKKEMRKRNFKTNITIDLTEFPEELVNDWSPRKKDFVIIKNRIQEKLKLKPNYYRYYGEYKPVDFFLKLVQ